MYGKKTKAIVKEIDLIIASSDSGDALLDIARKSPGYLQAYVEKEILEIELKTLEIRKLTSKINFVTLALGRVVSELHELNHE